MSERQVQTEQPSTVAIRAAQDAGGLLMSRYGGVPAVDSVGDHDMKLAVDRECEQLILAEIRAAFPSHSIITEESGPFFGDGAYVWYVDPLDGTVNFARGLPHFCTSIACYERDASVLGRPVAAVVHSPILDLTFVLKESGSAYLNDVELEPTDSETLARAMVAVAFTDRDGAAEGLGRLAARLSERAQKVRSLGATALDLCFLANRAFGGFVQRDTRIWDFAAGAAIAEATGCTVTRGPTNAAEQSVEGRHRIVAGAPLVYPELIELVREATGEPWARYASLS